MPISLTRRSVSTVFATAALPAVWSCAASTTANAVRKNIDALSADELETYKHAVGILQSRSASQPDSYQWQAALHNDFSRVRPDGTEGACEHRNELFLPWHRAHLAGFEFLLRATDPPRTANLALPYWDWSLPPSGVRFARAFEDDTSPLYIDGRYDQVTDETPPVQWDAAWLKRIIRQDTWEDFAGKPLGADGHGGSFGSLEDHPHNTIHSAIGTVMGNPESASRDPIYWSFHAYIDLVWARWQRLHTSSTTPQPFATPTAKIWVEPFTPNVGDMAQTGSLPAGYAYTHDYDFSIDDEGPPLVADARARSAPLPTSTTASGAVTSGAIRIDPATQRALLRLQGLRVLQDASYTISAYAHPRSVNLLGLSDEARAPYLADRATVWMSGRHLHHPTTELKLDLTERVRDEPNFVVTIIPEILPLDLTQASDAPPPLPQQPLWERVDLEQRS